MALYSPLAPRLAATRTNGGTSLTDIENLAPFDGPSGNNRRFWIGSNSGAGNAVNTLSDIYGPYWEIGSTNVRARLLNGQSALMPWAPAGGYMAGALGAVVMPTSTPSGAGCVICFSGDTAGSNGNFELGITTSGGTRAYGNIYTGTTTASLTSPSNLTNGNPHAIIFTTRANNDHELVVRDLVTGVTSSTTSTTNAGTTANTPPYYQMFFRTGGGDLNLLANARVYQTMFWSGGKTQAEMYEIVRAPLSIVAPAAFPMPLSMALASSAIGIYTPAIIS